MPSARASKSASADKPLVDICPDMQGHIAGIGRPFDVRPCNRLFPGRETGEEPHQNERGSAGPPRSQS